ncbi:hypothetical protein GJR96_05205 [Haloferax sp. MBLA0076]|uniref:Uncharacterized protein n=1 Tax=Haloferax litoreum TaxID=2666140 RepID=A0A6A8GEL1_9EURY|nr:MULTISPECIES: hypothetical protein [Haloferax]KAB1192874.1 hypothetical protein Hfx1148_05205 [Haloferax sp. CBA1148]MRX21359.1 hypothetical protein [Haloferax litoreum]
MNTTALLAAFGFATAGLVLIRSPERALAFKRRQTVNDPTLTATGRRQFEAVGVFLFVLAFGFLLLAFAN